MDPNIQAATEIELEELAGRELDTPSNKHKVLIIVGTSRAARRSYSAAKFVEKVGQEFPEIETLWADPLDFNLPNDGNDEGFKDPKYTELVRQADAFFIVSPEYNHGYPGSLKRLLDSELKLYIHKPVAFAGVSDGRWGGVRAIELLVGVVREMGMISTFTDVQFPEVQNLFDEKGEILDEKYIERVKRSYRELIWMSKALKWGRENLGN